ncbi:low molecular weight protein-tyrosine-phosphatase [Thermonema rossianum]|uniref:low molecular weight protein-tyrosine-phosphatase n=1 Tax=Thermonema rossianum TaxID=55505 RepID=UPI00056E3C7E|nr:low molecular weight protein-tyrosine-phosphatase [Thermonema rossianum]
MIKVLFVCLGNICRSPMAEGIFKKLLKEEGLENKVMVDSAGTGSWHIGELPDRRTRQTAEKHGILLNSRARQIHREDFEIFDYILVADRSNLRDVERLAQGCPHAKSKIMLIRAFDPIAPQSEVPDPYYGDLSDFEEVYQILDRSLRPFLDFIKKEHSELLQEMPS